MLHEFHLYLDGALWKKESDPSFLPMTRKEAEKLGLDQLDVILVSGDAYIDHPAFGAGGG